MAQCLLYKIQIDEDVTRAPLTSREPGNGHKCHHSVQKRNKRSIRTGEDLLIASQYGDKLVFL